MLCFISFLFVFIVVCQLEADTITLGQAILYGAYGLLMFWHTSKKYRTLKKKRRVQRKCRNGTKNGKNY